LESKTKRVSNRNGKAAKANERMAVPKNIGYIQVFTPQDTLIEGSDKTESNYAKT